LRALAAERGPKRMSAANHLEAAIVVDANRNPILSRRLDEVIAETAIVIEPVTRQQAEIARAAYRDFGKGSGPTGRASISATASPTPSPRLRASRCCSRATTFRGRTSQRRETSCQLPRRASADRLQ
jgi:hypothetical protein